MNEESMFNKIKRTAPSILLVIYISYISGILLLVGLGIPIMVLCFCTIVFLNIKNIENIFLMWVCLSPLLTLDELSFLNLGGHPILNFDRVIIGILFLMILLKAAVRQKNLLAANKLEFSMILFLLILLFSIIFKSESKSSGIRFLLDCFILPFMIFFLSKNLINDKYFNKFLNIIVIIGVYLALMGIYEGISGTDIFPTYEGLAIRSGWLRVNGPFKMDTTYGVNMTFCFLITLFKYIINSNNDNKSKTGKIYLFPLFLILLGLIFNFYRGIWIALFIGVISWFIMRGKGLGKGFILISFLSIFLILFSQQIKYTKVFQDRIANVNTIESRFGKFKRAYETFKNNPITGIGLRNYNETQHNTFLWMFSEIGIIGSISFLSIFLLLIYYAKEYIIIANTSLDKEYSYISLSIIITFLITWLGLNVGYDMKINTLFYSIIGVTMGKLSRNLKKV